jgi:hypothetical protein
MEQLNLRMGQLSNGSEPHNMRGLKIMQHSGGEKYFCACNRDNYMDKSEGHLNCQDIHSVIITLLAFSNVDTILRFFNITAQDEGHFCD